MLKISHSLKEIINSNALLQFGLHHRLLNLSQVAKFVKPLLEAKTKKDIKSSSAILMALSRLQRETKKTIPKMEKFSIINLTVHSGLCTMSFLKSNEFLHGVEKIYSQIQKHNGYITLNQGANEITMIIDEASIIIVQKIVSEKPKNTTKNLAALGIQFDQKYYEIPGMLYYLMQQISLQGINIREISSTYTEIIIYVDQKDIRLLFDTIYNCFSKN